MNILILNWRDPEHPLAGGAEQMVFEHAKYWKRRGADVTWFASHFKKAKREEFIDGIKIIRRGSQYTVFIWAFFYYLMGKLGRVMLVVDCFHFIPYFTRFYIKNIPIVAILQEVAGKLWFENIFFPISKIGYIVEPFIIKSYRNIVFITGSKSAKSDLINLGFSKDKVHVINHGITRYKPRNDSKEDVKTLIFLGRVSKDKGIEDAINMLSVLTNHKMQVKLWVVGRPESSEYERKVKKLIKDKGLMGIVKLFGYVSFEEKFELLARSWALVHPSKKEGWGLNVIEANSVGVPAIGYKVCGLVDSIVDKQTGLLVQPDPISLSKGVELLISNPTLYSKMCRNAKQWSDKFNWDKSAQKSYKLILSLQKK